VNISSYSYLSHVFSNSWPKALFSWSGWGHILKPSTSGAPRVRPMQDLCRLVAGWLLGGDGERRVGRPRFWSTLEGRDKSPNYFEGAKYHLSRWMTGSRGALTKNQAATTKKWEIEPRIWSQLCGLSFCRCLAFYLPVSPLTTTAWIVENKLNVTLFAGNSIVFSPCFWWRHQEWHGAHRRSRSRFLCVMLHLHIQWSATREQRSSSMLGGDL
jgi:hypothetical protein